MTKKITIAIDAMGGDNSPDKVINGIINHYSSNKITLRLQGLEAEKMFWRVKNKGVHVWSLPQDYFADSQEPLALPDLPEQEEIL